MFGLTSEDKSLQDYVEVFCEANYICVDSVLFSIAFKQGVVYTPEQVEGMVLYTANLWHLQNLEPRYAYLAQ